MSIQLPLKFSKDSDLEDGPYVGSWSGHVLSISIPKGPDRTVLTKLGVRGLFRPVSFLVVDGKVDEDTLQRI